MKEFHTVLWIDGESRQNLNFPSWRHWGHSQSHWVPDESDRWRYGFSARAVGVMAGEAEHGIKWSHEILPFPWTFCGSLLPVAKSLAEPQLTSEVPSRTKVSMVTSFSLLSLCASGQLSCSHCRAGPPAYSVLTTPTFLQLLLICDIDSSSDSTSSYRPSTWICTSLIRKSSQGWNLRRLGRGDRSERRINMGDLNTGHQRPGLQLWSELGHRPTEILKQEPGFSLARLPSPSTMPPSSLWRSQASIQKGQLSSDRLLAACPLARHRTSIGFLAYKWNLGHSTPEQPLEVRAMLISAKLVACRRQERRESSVPRPS